MDVDRATRLLPVVLAVIFGLLGMHALVVADTEQPVPATPHSVVSPSAAPMDGHQTAVSAPDVLAPFAPHDGHSPVHELLHLCLAILAALLVLALGLVLVTIAGSPTAPTSSNPGRRRLNPPPRPPPTSVRLAQLCVMRN